MVLHGHSKPIDIIFFPTSWSIPQKYNTINQIQEEILFFKCNFSILLITYLIKKMIARTPLQNDKNLKYFKEEGNLRQKEKMGKKSDFI